LVLHIGLPICYQPKILSNSKPPNFTRREERSDFKTVCSWKSNLLNFDHGLLSTI